MFPALPGDIHACGVAGIKITPRAAGCFHFSQNGRLAVFSQQAQPVFTIFRVREAGFRFKGKGSFVRRTFVGKPMKKFPCGLRRSWLLSSALRAEISSPAGEICSRLCREISSLCERVNFFSSGKEISPLARRSCAAAETDGSYLLP